MKVETNSSGDTLVLSPRLTNGEKGKPGVVAMLRNEASGHICSGVRRMLIDLSDVDFMNSTDIGSLVGITKQMQVNKGLLVICGLGLRLAETLAVVRLLNALPLRILPEEGLKALEREKPTDGGIARLTGGNPSLEEIRHWWDSVLKNQVESVPSVPPPTRVSAVVPLAGMNRTSTECEPPPPVARVASSQGPEFSDWQEALECIRKAKELYQRRGLPFDTAMSFKEFISQFAERLLEERGES